MSTALLQIYKSGKLRDMWQERTQKLIEANPQVSPIRCGEIMAAMLANDIAREECELDDKVNPFTMTLEEESFYNWLYVEENGYSRADLQKWSGTRTMLADTPDGTYEPEWMQYIKWPQSEQGTGERQAN